MGFLKTVFDWLKRVIADAAQNQYTDALLTTIGLDPKDFWQSLAVSVIALTIPPAAGFIMGPSLWRHVKAWTIRRSANDGFVIVYCRIAEDKDDTIHRIIKSRLLAHFKAFSGIDGDAKFKFSARPFPLSLSADEDSRSYGRSIRKAKYWLRRTNGDVLIWGSRSITEYDGVIRFVGVNTDGEIIEPREIRFNNRAEDFDEALALSIAYEISRLTQNTLSRPEGASMEALRRGAAKIEAVLHGKARSISENMRARMRSDLRSLQLEIANLSEDEAEQKKEQEAASQELKAIDASAEPLAFASVSLRYGILVRKLNWANPDPQELEKARLLVEEAKEIFERAGELDRAGVAAIELCDLVFLERERQMGHAPMLNVFLSEAYRLALLANSPRLLSRFRVRGAAFWGDQREWMLEMFGLAPNSILETDWISVLRTEAVNLSDSEIVTLAECVTDRIRDRAQVAGSIEGLLEVVRVLEECTAICKQMNEATNLRYRVALVSALNMTAHMLTVIKEIEPEKYERSKAPEPFYIEQRARRAAEAVSHLLEPVAAKKLDRLGVLACTDSANSLLGLALNAGDREEALRILDRVRLALKVAEAEYPRYVDGIRSSLASMLNSFSSITRSPDEAFEAKALLEKVLAVDPENLHNRYVDTFSDWLIARNTPKEDAARRRELAEAARSNAQNNLAAAIAASHVLSIDGTEQVLRWIARDFPELENA